MKKNSCIRPFRIDYFFVFKRLLWLLCGSISRRFNQQKLCRHHRPQRRKTIITMQSDVAGEVDDFAMVVPVPSILKKNQVKVVDPAIFEKLAAYSAPRLTEYYDADPCTKIVREDMDELLSSKRSIVSMRKISQTKKERPLPR